MARRAIPAETKAAVLEAVRGGANKAEVAKQYGISLPTVYNYLKAETVPTEAVEA